MSVKRFTFQSVCVLLTIAVLASIVWLLAFRTGAQERIIYTRPSGEVSIVIPAEICLQQLMRPVAIPTPPGECPALGVNRAGAVNWIRDKDVPPGASDIRILDAATLPPRSRMDAGGKKQHVRDAWRQHPDGTVTIDETRVPRP